MDPRTFFQVVPQSYERQWLIMATNLDFSQWPPVFGSGQLTGTLLYRLTHHTHILTMNGESFRFWESMSKKEGCSAMAPFGVPNSLVLITIASLGRKKLLEL